MLFRRSSIPIAAASILSVVGSTSALPAAAFDSKAPVPDLRYPGNHTPASCPDNILFKDFQADSDFGYTRDVFPGSTERDPWANFPRNTVHPELSGQPIYTSVDSKGNFLGYQSDNGQKKCARVASGHFGLSTNEAKFSAPIPLEDNTRYAFAFSLSKPTQYAGIWVDGPDHGYLISSYEFKPLAGAGMVEFTTKHTNGWARFVLDAGLGARVGEVALYKMT